MAKKLFELISIEGQLKTQVATTRSELQNTFEKKRHLFEEKSTTFKSLEEGVAPFTEQQSDIQTNVMSELRWIAAIWSKAMDTSYQVADGNTRAKADVVLDNGDVLLRNVPGLALLELEKRASEIEQLLKSVPTLDPAKGFRPDPDKGKGVYLAREVNKIRTKKIQTPLKLYDATPEHPAQVQVISIDVPAGTIQELEWSGLITPANKGLLIERAEEVRRAVKQALQRANEAEVGDQACGKKVFDYIIGTE